MSEQRNLLEQSTRVAIAAYLHDLGKLAERANIPAPNLDVLKNLHCPKSWVNKIETDKHTHIHAAYTSLAFDVLEPFMPDFAGQNSAPFTGRGDSKNRIAGQASETDSLVNAAANHHRPDTFLQWVVAQADRIASGLDRESFNTYNTTDDTELRDGRNGEYVRGKESVRQATLFEQIDTTSPKPTNPTWKDLTLRYPLTTLNATGIFPQKAESLEKNNAKAAGQTLYKGLWEELLKGIAQIPESHRNNTALWLDHFDSLWLHVTQAVPSTTANGHIPDVSLYDHSHTTAALAVAIWRYHEATNTTQKERVDIDEDKCLLIQGDFFGIQNFVFADGADSSKKANKLLRGRSFMVNLLTECAALKLLEALELPPTSLVLNAAGKFLIVAHNTDNARKTVNQCRTELNTWFLEHSFGESGIGIACTAASTADFCVKKEGHTSKLGERDFDGLIERMVKDLDVQKHRRFSLCSTDKSKAAPAHFDVLAKYENGECPVQGRIPAAHKNEASLLAQDQITIGDKLLKNDRIAIVRNSTDMLGHKDCLQLDYFGYYIAFVEDGNIRGEFSKLAKTNRLARLLDFSSPDINGNCWNGYARRFVNTYAPRFTEEEQLDQSGRYNSLRDDDGEIPRKVGTLKTLQHLALDNKEVLEQHWHGINAVAALKGDIDNLGTLFQTGLKGKLTFSRWSSLSRQVHFFFSLWLPWACEYGGEKDLVLNQDLTCLKDIYTVFAGGDDFFLLAPWHSQVKAAGVIKAAFDKYVGNLALEETNEQKKQKITFSAGIVIIKPDLPIRLIAHDAEAVLEKAKANLKVQPKNAIHLWHAVPFSDWQALSSGNLKELEALLPHASTGIIYDLMKLANMASKIDEDPSNALWRSKLAYRLTRYCEQNKLSDNYVKISEFLTKQIENNQKSKTPTFIIPLSLLAYLRRS